jgi:hypothetical protein
MNYQNFSQYSNIPPGYSKENNAFYDEGNGVPQINANNMTIQDIYRTPFLFIQDHKNDYTNMAPISLKGIHSNSELSKLFFSDTNIKRLQKLIKNKIYERTNGEFRLDVDQDQNELFIWMRSTYIEQARFLPGEIVRQVKRLNQKLVDDITPGILTNIRQDYGYIKEINKPLDPIIRPQNVNHRGRQLLPSVSTIYSL